MARLTLREGLSFCRVSDRLVFLDVPCDRYFCLTREAERDFEAMLAGAPPAGRAQAAADLVREAVSGDAPIASAVSRPLPRTSLCYEAGSAPAAAVLAMLVRRQACRAWLRSQSFAAVLRRLERRKAAIAPGNASPGPLARIAAAYRQSAWIASPRDRCLADSLAVAGALAAAGIRSDLVLAVKLRPFQAHCWVEAGDAVVNDMLDAVRLFTPIRIV